MEAKDHDLLIIISEKIDNVVERLDRDREQHAENRRVCQKQFSKALDAEVVRREFSPVKSVAYGLIGLVLFGVGVGLLKLIISHS